MRDLLEHDLTMCNWDLFETILKDHQLEDFLSAIYKAMKSKEVEQWNMKRTILKCARTWNITQPVIQTEII